MAGSYGSYDAVATHACIFLRDATITGMATRLSSEEARRRIVDAARELAEETGMAGLTIDGVAERSGVAKTTIYRNWPTIEELRVETVGSLVAQLPTPDTGDLQRDLEACAEMFAATVVDRGHRALMLSVLGAEADSERLLELRRELMACSTNPVEDVIVAAVERGDLPADLDVTLASDLVRGPLFVRLVIDGIPTSPQQRATIIRAAIAGMPELAKRS